ncbi:MAG: hypothetical protein HOF72_02550 [Planctomycetaceae bacterium]|nr:hypothetical protein [Planctomycetaceae bacterium]
MTLQRARLSSQRQAGLNGSAGSAEAVDFFVRFVGDILRSDKKQPLLVNLMIRMQIK